MIQHSLGFYKPLTIFQSSDKVGFDSFYFCVCVCVEGLEFGATYSAILLMSLPMRGLTLKWKKSETILRLKERISGDVNTQYRKEEVIIDEASSQRR